MNDTHLTMALAELGQLANRCMADFGHQRTMLLGAVLHEIVQASVLSEQDQQTLLVSVGYIADQLVSESCKMAALDAQEVK